MQRLLLVKQRLPSPPALHFVFDLPIDDIIANLEVP